MAPQRRGLNAGPSARARGRMGGRPYKMTAAKLRLAMAAMGNIETKIGDLCEELGITKQTLYRHVAPDGSIRDDRPWGAMEQPTDLRLFCCS